MRLFDELIPHTAHGSRHVHQITALLCELVPQLLKSTVSFWIIFNNISVTFITSIKEVIVNVC